MKERFFDKLDWAAFWTATVVTFAVYFHTLGPSVGLEDSGELATAAANLGVPHPPGYPFWTFCSWIFCKLFSWVTYMGHPTPAWAVSCCSAFFGAFATGCTAMLICRSGRDFLGGERVNPETPAGLGAPEFLPAPEAANGWLAFGGAVGGALTFAFSPVEWSQSTIVEIYSLNALFLMWVFLLSYRWMRRPSDRILWLTAFVFGLGLTNYQVLLFAIVPLALIILLRNVGLFRDVFTYLIPVALTAQILQVGQLYRAEAAMSSDAINKHEALVGKALSTPSTAVLVIALVLLVGSIVVAAVLRSRGDGRRSRQVALYGGGAGVLCFLLATTLFAHSNVWMGVTAPVAPLVEPTRYAWIAVFMAASVVAAVYAVLQDEDGKLGESPKTLRFLILSGVLAAVGILVAATVPAAGNAGYQGEPYPWGRSTLIFLALVAALVALGALTRRGLCFAVPAAGLQIAAFVLLKHGAMNGLTHPASWWFGWPIAWNFVLLALAWVTLPNGRSVAGAAFFAQLGVSFYAYMPIVSDLRNPPMNWGYPRTWEGFKHAIMRGQYEAIAFHLPTKAGLYGYFKDVMDQFTDVLALFALVPFAAGHWIVNRARRKAFWQWMVPALVCFLLMSVLLIGLANVKGDLQDGFIQKVKFISSHAMIALWIGYGLVFAGAWLMRWVPAKILCAVMIAVALVTPIVQNYVGDYRLGVNEIGFKLGGSEQNGHTFGWQFGAYQLDGAKAVREQLVADEEPLPDPEWPEPMEKSSIFFGGTDPGRFVPTYMIYSADYRPDVYLITQNALADDTYMSVERDLYGDEIWIPSKEDSAAAFDQYVREAQADPARFNELLANGTLRMENGRVQVTGALAVMDINGILTKKMHEHDRLRHAFYVEESYVIRWMYPYLSPHGLIMKINADPTPYDMATARKDADFWDWYVRRLLGDPAYARDFAGQKSFSKLRAALAGLYTSQGRYRESAQAFREAVLLYPASPEATFRYAQECLLPFRRYEVTLELMDYTDYLDPENTRTAQLRDYVTRTVESNRAIAELEPKLTAGKLTEDEAIRLAGALVNFGRLPEAARCLAPLVQSKTVSPDELRQMARVLMSAGEAYPAEVALVRYLTARPQSDADAWIDLCRLQYRAGRIKDAQQSFIAGYNLNREKIFRLLNADKELQAVALPLFQRPQQQSSAL